jgi:hypothetical protein
VHDAAATPIRPVARSSTMIDQVAEAFAGKEQSMTAAAMAGRRTAIGMERSGGTGSLDGERADLV